MKELLFKLNPWAQIKFWKELLRQEREISVKLEKEAYLLREELDSVKRGNSLNPYDRDVKRSIDVLNTTNQ